eukprot:810434_1
MDIEVLTHSPVVAGNQSVSVDCGSILSATSKSDSSRSQTSSMAPLKRWFFQHRVVRSYFGITGLRTGSLCTLVLVCAMEIALLSIQKRADTTLGMVTVTLFSITLATVPFGVIGISMRRLWAMLIFRTGVMMSCSHQLIHTMVSLSRPTNCLGMELEGHEKECATYKIALLGFSVLALFTHGLLVVHSYSMVLRYHGGIENEDGGFLYDCLDTKRIRSVQ